MAKLDILINFNPFAKYKFIHCLFHQIYKKKYEYLNALLLTKLKTSYVSCSGGIG